GPAAVKSGTGPTGRGFQKYRRRSDLRRFPGKTRLRYRPAAGSLRGSPPQRRPTFPVPLVPGAGPPASAPVPSQHSTFPFVLGYAVIVCDYTGGYTKAL